ncbi:methyltransferase domain-containing protein [uncultured Methanoregula sp.]|uniref:class I SAM-dependent methyltransferase n=1 Tax=uncultured Methanoregula sp. TaxID=1005933 RepID=UPI002AAA8DEF|nr:methyltransferase domain-containing protein [uncultured Methanoregula sp.]
MNTFWEERFLDEGKIWGDNPSRTAVYAIELFKKAGVREVLIPGSGYGRNAEAFARAGFEVTGIEISKTAVSLARQGLSKIRYHYGSVLDMPFDHLAYDGIYCFNVLHLFRKNDRRTFLERCREQLKDGGVIFFAVFSDNESSYGTGRMVEENTFESRPEREVHYYSEEDLVSEFRGLEIIATGMMEDPEEHGKEGRHIHLLRYIYARK